MKIIIIAVMLSLLALCIISQKGNILTINKTYIVYNEKKQILDANVFINNKTIQSKYTKQIIINFKNSKTKFISIIVDNKLIGMPEIASSIEIVGSEMIFPNEAKMTVPISEGPNKLLSDFFVSDSLVYFNTFDDLKKFGSTIILKKVK
jgi:hypothetical protein